MRRLALALAASAACAAALIAGTWLVARGPGASDPTGAVRPTIVEELAPTERAIFADAPGVAPARRALEPPSAEEEGDPTARAEPAEPRQAVLSGRLVRSDGAPAAGALVELMGWPGNDERVAEHGLPRDWSDPSVRTALDGSFELRFVPPRAFQFALDARVDGFAPVAWRWGSIEEGARLDLGRTVLEPGGSILVRIVRPDGRSAGLGWQVHADHRVEAGATGRDASRRPARLDPERGEWLVSDMPPGPAKVSAYSPMANWIHAWTKPVRPGETIACELVYDGPENASRIVVGVSTTPILTVDPATENVMLVGGPLAEPLRCERTIGASGYDFPDVPPGEYTVVVDDPRFERWERAGVSPGERVTARVRGNAALVVEVVDRETGAAVTDWSLSLRTEGLNSYPNVFAMSRTDPGGAEPERFDSLVSIEYTILLEAAGYPPRSVPVSALAPGETREVRVELLGGASVAGVVRSARDGSPIAGAEVELFRGDLLARGERRIDWWRIWGQSLLSAHRLGRATTDDAGRFRIESAEHGELVVRAVGGAGLHALEHVTLSPRGPEPEVSIDVHEPAFLVGRVTARAGAPLDTLLVRAGNEDGVGDLAMDQWKDGFDSFVEDEVATDGSFRLGPLGNGSTRVGIVRADLLPNGGVPDPRVLLERSVEIGGPGVVPLDLQLGDAWPVAATLTLRIEGQVARHLDVSLDRIEGDAPGSGHLSGAHGPTDEEGRVELQPLSGSYRARVRGDTNWRWEDDRVLEVSPHSPNEWEIDVPAARGRLRIVDGATNRPCSGERVWVYRVDEERGIQPELRSTDDKGEIELLVPRGSILHVVRFGPSRRIASLADLEGAPRVDWTANGPEPTSIVLR